MSQIIIYDTSSIMGDVSGLIPDSGTSPVLPNGSGYITVTGGLNINTVGSANTLTINLDNDVTLTNNDANAISSFLQFDKSRSGIITSGDVLGTINFTGDDGVTQIEGASIEAVTTGTIGVDQIPTQLLFYTHPDAVQGSPDLQMTLDENGIITLHQYARGVVQSDASGVLSSSEGTNGQLLIGSSSGAPAWANLTEGTGVGISNGANSITISVADAVPINFDTDDGTATPAANSLTVAGGTNINTAGSGSTVTVNLDNDITLTNESVSSTSSTIQFDKSRSAGVITSGDFLGQVKFTGNDGTIQVESARIEAESTGTIGVNQIPGRLLFYTHPDSTSAITQRMILDEAGTLTLLTPDSGTAFTVVGGGAAITGRLTVSTDNIFISDTDNDADGRLLVFQKTRSGSPVQVGDTLGSVDFTGDDDGAGSLFTSAYMRCTVDSGTIATDRIPTKLDFYTHPDSVAAAPTKNMTLDKDGILTLHQYSDGAIVSDSSGNLSSTNDTAGYVLTSNGAGSAPTFQAAAAGGISWSVVTGTTQTLAADNGYFANNGTQVDFSLPASASVGDTFVVAGMNNATGWTITQGAGQTIHFGDTDTTTGAGGSLTSTATYDVVELVCNVANTDFVVTRSVGNITIV